MRSDLAWRLGLVLMIATGCRPGSAETLRFGTESDDLPFSSVVPGRPPSGFSVDVGNELCRRLRAQCEWHGMAFDRLFPTLKAKGIDAAISQITVTPARSAEVIFSDPVTRTGGLLIVPNLSTITNDPASMKGRTIGVQTGTTHEAYADSVLARDAHLLHFATQGQAFEALAAGRIDATLCDLELGHEWLEGHSGAFRFADRPIIDPSHYGAFTAIAMRSGDDRLRARIDQALSEMIRDGSFANINRRYFTFSIAPGSFGEPL